MNSGWIKVDKGVTPLRIDTPGALQHNELRFGLLALLRIETAIRNGSISAASTTTQHNSCLYVNSGSIASHVGLMSAFVFGSLRSVVYLIVFVRLFVFITLVVSLLVRNGSKQRMCQDRNGNKDWTEWVNGM